MAVSDQDAAQYLDIAYDVVDGSPEMAFDQNEVENKLGMDEDRKRRTLRELENRGLVEDEGGTRYRLTLPAIHQVEEARLAAGRSSEVDPRREQRGTYVRTLYNVADGDPETPVKVETLFEELGFEPEVEERTRDYLAAAGLIEADDAGKVQITRDGADWVEST